MKPKKKKKKALNQPSENQLNSPAELANSTRDFQIDLDDILKLFFFLFLQFNGYRNKSGSHKEKNNFNETAQRYISKLSSQFEESQQGFFCFFFNDRKEGVKRIRVTRKTFRTTPIWLTMLQTKCKKVNLEILYQI